MFSTFPEDLVTHGVSTRIGGVSKEPFDSLNLALHVGDEPTDVIANRKKFLRALGFKLSDIVTPNQFFASTKIIAAAGATITPIQSPKPMLS